MKHRAFLLLLPFFVSFVLAQTDARRSNPVFPSWYADPEGVMYGDTCWIYPTWSDEYEKQTFFDCFSSTDLVNWTKHERILDNDEIKWAWRAMWAPAVLRKDGKYYLFFGANDIQNNNDYGGIGVAVADKPEGPYKDLLKRPLIRAIVNGAQPIDQYVFLDDDGTYYMYYGGWGHCNIVKLKDDFTGIVPFDDGELYKELTPQGYTEGPFMFKKDDKYYFMWSEGGWTGPHYSVAYAIADSPFGPFRKRGTILEPDPHLAMGAGHHSVICMPDGQYYMVYHRRPLGETHHNHRVTCIDPMHFNEDGTIKPVEMDEAIPCAPVITPASFTASRELQNETAAMALDDNLSDKWCSGGDDPEKWLELTFAEEMTVCQWKVIHSGIETVDFITKDFRLQYFNDKTRRWHDADVITNNTDNITNRYIDNPFSTTKVRLKINQAEQHGAGAARIRLFQVYGTKTNPSSVEYTEADDDKFSILSAFSNPLGDEVRIKCNVPTMVDKLVLNVYNKAGACVDIQKYIPEGRRINEIYWTNKFNFLSELFLFDLQAFSMDKLVAADTKKLVVYRK